MPAYGHIEGSNGWHIVHYARSVLLLLQVQIFFFQQAHILLSQTVYTLMGLLICVSESHFHHLLLPTCILSHEEPFIFPPTQYNNNCKNTIYLDSPIFYPTNFCNGLLYILISQNAFVNYWSYTKQCEL